MDAAPSDEDLMDTMRRIVSFDRLRSKVVSTGKKGRFQWSEMDNAEERLMDHVSRREVSSESKLRDAMDQLLLTPLDVDKPLWDITVLTLCDGATWNPSPGGPDRKPPVVCVRVSHAIGDGISLVSILNRMCGGDVETVDFKRRANTSYSLSACVSNPMKILYFFVWVFNCIYAVITAVGTPFGPHDSKTAFCDTSKKVVYSGKRTMVNCPGFALSDLKEVKTKMGCTVNDVVCACLAGALHKYQEYRSDPARDDPLWFAPPSPSRFWVAPRRVMQRLDVRLVVARHGSDVYRRSTQEDAAAMPSDEVYARGARRERAQRRRGEAPRSLVPIGHHLRFHVQAFHGVHQRPGTHRAGHDVQEPGDGDDLRGG